MDQFCSPEELQRYSEFAGDIRRKALDDVLMQAAKRMWRKKLAAGEGGVFAEYLMQRIGLTTDDFVGETRGRKKDTTRWFVTISAKDPVDHYQFWQQMKKCVKKVKIQGSGMYVIEQRSEMDQDPYGWHIHWLVEFETQSSKAVIIQQVYQCFQRFLAGSNYVDARPVYTDEDWEAKRKYISGEKKQDKMGKVEKDRFLRKKHGYPEIISY